MIDGRIYPRDLDATDRLNVYDGQTTMYLSSRRTDLILDGQTSFISTWQLALLPPRGDFLETTTTDDDADDDDR